MTAINELLELTRRVQALAESGDWAGAAELERQRRPLVERFLAERPQADALREAAPVIRQVVEMDRALVARVTEQRRAILGEASTDMTAARVARAYALAP